MKIVEYLQEHKSLLNNGLPIELLDVIDGRSVYAGSFQVLVDELQKAGLEHVKNARFVFDDMDNGRDRIVLWYVKDLKEYNDFDLRNLGAKMKRLEVLEQSWERMQRETLDGRLEQAAIDSGKTDVGGMGQNEYLKG